MGLRLWFFGWITLASLALLAPIGIWALEGPNRRVTPPVVAPLLVEPPAVKLLDSGPPAHVDEPFDNLQLNDHDRALAAAALAAKGSFTVDHDFARTIHHKVVKVLHAGREHVVIVSSGDAGDCHGCKPHAHAVRFVADATTPAAVSPIDYWGSWGNPLEAQDVSLITIAGQPALAIKGFSSGGGTSECAVLFHRLTNQHYRLIGTLVTTYDNKNFLGKDYSGYWSWTTAWNITANGTLTIRYTVLGAGQDHPSTRAARRYAFRANSWWADGKPTTEFDW